MPEEKAWTPAEQAFRDGARKLFRRSDGDLSAVEEHTLGLFDALKPGNITVEAVSDAMAHALDEKKLELAAMKTKEAELLKSSQESKDSKITSAWMDASKALRDAEVQLYDDTNEISQQLPDILAIARKAGLPGRR